MKMTPYPEPISRDFLRYPQKADPTWIEWCGLCGILLHRRHSYWRWLEIWSSINSGLPEEDFAHHVNYIDELVYAAIETKTDWMGKVLDVLKSNPL